MRSYFFRSIYTISVLFALFLSSCSSTNQTQDILHYVGKVEGTDAFIGLVTDGTRITAYVCDGDGTDINISAWFKGELSDNSFTLQSVDPLILAGELASGKINGTLQLADGSQHAFMADVVDSPAGVFRQEESENGSTVVTGWIVLPNQEYRGGKFSSIVGGPPAIVGGPPAIVSRMTLSLP